MQKPDAAEETSEQSPTEFFDSLAVYFCLRCTNNDEDASAFLLGFRYGLTTLHRMLGAACNEAKRAGSQAERMSFVSIVEQAVDGWDLGVHFEEVDINHRPH